VRLKKINSTLPKAGARRDRVAAASMNAFTTKDTKEHTDIGSGRLVPFLATIYRG